MATEPSGKNPFSGLIQNVGGYGAFAVALLTGIATVTKQLATIQQHRKDAMAFFGELTFYAGTALLWTYVVFFVAALLLGIVLGFLRVKEETYQTLLYPTFFLCVAYAVFMTIKDPDTEKILAAHDGWTFVAQMAGVCVLLWAVYALYYTKAWIDTHIKTKTDGKE
jgi:hypothetical protein